MPTATGQPVLDDALLDQLAAALHAAGRDRRSIPPLHLTAPQHQP